MNVKKQETQILFSVTPREIKQDKQVQKYMRAKGCFIYLEFICIL